MGRAQAAASRRIIVSTRESDPWGLCWMSLSGASGSAPAGSRPDPAPPWQSICTNHWGARPARRSKRLHRARTRRCRPWPYPCPSSPSPSHSRLSRFWTLHRAQPQRGTITPPKHRLLRLPTATAPFARQAVFHHGVARGIAFVCLSPSLFLPTLVVSTVSHPTPLVFGPHHPPYTRLRLNQARHGTTWTLFSLVCYGAAMDIATLVRHVISAFDEASSLVKRIQDKRAAEGRELPEEPTRDLLDSLALGPVIVRGHYDHDLKRFGEPYACGDIQAREQMKDVLLQLQMILMDHLRKVWMDDMDPDYNALQSASDDCRVNAGVCLGQLSQRLSDAARAQAMYPANMMPYTTNGMLMPPMSPSLHYSSSRSTASSTFSRAVPPRTPDSTADHFSTMSLSGMSNSTVRPFYDERKPSGGMSYGSQSPYIRWNSPPPDIPPVPNIGQQYRQPDSETQSLHSMRRPSSHTLAPEDSVLLSPATNNPDAGSPPHTSPPLPGALDLDRDSYVSYGVDSQPATSPDVSRAPSTHQIATNGENPREYDQIIPIDIDGSQFRYPTVYELQPIALDPRQSLTSYSARTQATNNYNNPDHVFYLQQNSRPPVPDPLRPQPTLQPTYPPPERSQLRPQPSQILSYHTQVVKPQSPKPPIAQPLFSTTNAGRSIPMPATSPQPQYQSDPQTPRPSTTAPIPLEANRSMDSVARPVPTRPPPPPQAAMPPPARTTSVGVQKPSTVSTPMAPPPPTPNPSVQIPVAAGPLNLATDKNTLGFCKGAQRLQVGLEKKAFSAATRPLGVTGMIQYWRCEKCNFEGPMHSSLATTGKKAGKQEKTFDPKIRVSGENGVRYRWTFLAKSHVQCKTMPEGVRDGSFGTFQCIFCVAEGERRGWLAGGGGPKGDGSSVMSGTSGASRTSGALFGNVSSFMEHLALHRRQAWWPCQEMCNRMKCVVGRVAEAGEDFDVNLLPL